MTTRTERGFTMVEVAVAVAVLGLILFGLAAALAVSTRGNGMTRERSTATQAARGQIEEVLAYPDFSTIPAQFDGRGFGAGSGAYALLPRSGDADGLPGEVEVDSTDPRLLRVTVRVLWRGVGGDEALELSTLLANTDPAS